MKKDLYQVTIPAVLTDLVGRGNMRDKIKEAVQDVFADWAKDELINKIQVTKPREKKNGGEDG